MPAAKDPECRLPVNIAIAIATTGRRDILTATVMQLARQTRLPDCLYVCPATPDDLDAEALKAFPAPTEIIFGPRGSSHQRNAILKSAGAADLIVFLDDDYLADTDYLAEAERLFVERQDIVVASGFELADGAQGPGLTVATGLDILSRTAPLSADAGIRPTYAGYGCNMVIRARVAREHAIEFDERLPLYGWWEDVDFSRCLSAYGSVCRSDRLRGVHLGSKNGKTPGKRLGYSQVANLIYMATKGSVSRKVAYKKIAANVTANLVRSFVPEPWIDRRGRLAGNFIAFAHLLTGKLAPENVQSL